MSAADRRARAKRDLEALIQELGELRNATPRDPGFKHWRQNSLTLIQRYWPGDSTKSERFRRIPFSAPSTRADVKMVREFFERGCGEALNYLRLLLVEVERGRVGTGSDVPRAAPGAEAPSADDFPTVELPASSGEAAAPTPQPASGAPQPAAAAPGTPPAPPAPQTPAVPSERAVRESGGGPTAPHRKSGSRMRGKNGGRLKEMLGLDQFERPFAAVPPEPAPPEARVEHDAAAEAVPLAPVAGPPEGGEPSAPGEAKPAAETAAGPAGAAPAPPPALWHPVAADPGEVERQEPGPAASAEGAEPDAVTRAADEFLRSSPVLRAQGKPLRAREEAAVAAERESSSSAAGAVRVVARQVADLGVPEGRRAQMRALLLGLASELDQPAPSWNVMAEAVGAAMEFPPLARMLLPLLSPELERAA